MKQLDRGTDVTSTSVVVSARERFGRLRLLRSPHLQLHRPQRRRQARPGREHACGSLSLAGADPNVGKTKWWLHTNTGSGFAAHTDFALPTGYAKGYFNDLEGSSNCDSFNGYARPNYRLTDLDQNGKLDMVVTYACGSLSLPGADPDVGKTKWNWH